jgi:hypothetical protein
MTILRQAALAAIAIAALATVAPQAMAQSSKLSAKAQNLAAIMADVRAKGKSRVIVEFSVSAADISTKSGLAARKASVRSVQDAVLASSFGSVANASASDRALSRMNISPMFAIMANEAELDRLAADSRVVRIHLDGLNYPNLID